MENDKRNCYCSLWDKPLEAERLRKNGVPEGYCGLCFRCGKPGHLRHAFAGPYTAEFCDKSYKVQDAIDVGKLLLIPAGFILVVTLFDWL